MTVNLTRIYTKLGDDGETHLGDMSRVPKTDPRIEAYGTVDELNAHVGVADHHGRAARRLPRAPARGSRTTCSTSAPTCASRRAVRATGSACGSARADGVARGAVRRGERHAAHRCESFVLPGGTAAAAQLHVCRTVCRRAERRTLVLGEAVNPEVIRYLNRLSDLLFILSRGCNGGDEPLWQPGANR